MVGSGVLSAMNDLRISINYQQKFVGVKRRSDIYWKTIGTVKSNLTATTAKTVSMKLERQRRQQNVEGDFYVDQKCINCDVCRWMAPQVFTLVDRKSVVYKQPSCEEESLHALLSCPTGSIHTEKPARDILEAQETFLLSIDEQRIPGVYHCGYHSEASYGDTSYFITHPDGNILVDSPRYTERLAHKIEFLGGVHYMFLTHKDDVADHKKWSKKLGCHRVLHSQDGCVSLFYKPLKVMFTGDHFGKEQSELSIWVQYNHDSVPRQLESVRKLLDFEFEWILPVSLSTSGIGISTHNCIFV
ncbi:hypothetical protein MKW94_024269 [Papaver nudicaule]|uniref:Metallo-beta-lactamase domain-containing protein n=1 Tax=Papaver nudicaule TaxID=74823 RepID=A0AA41RQ86_PAPNU|nr:hypothetical protein [Papaver nudicaule]